MLALISLAQQDMETAKTLIGEARRLSPEAVPILLDFGEIHVHCKNEDLAEDAFRKVCAIEPLNATAILYRGYLSYFRGQYESALSFFDQGFKLAQKHIAKGFAIQYASSLVLVDRAKEAPSILKEFLPQFHCRLSKIRTGAEFCNLHGGSYIEALTKEEAYYTPPVFFGEAQIPHTVTLSLPECYLAELADVETAGATGYVFCGESALLDEGLRPDSYQYTSISRPTTLIQRHGKLLLISESDELPEIESAVMLSGVNSWHFYHWIYEYLVKFLLLSNAPKYSQWPLIVDRAVVEHPILKELLDIFNENGRELIIVEPFQRLKIKKLAYPSPLHWLDLKDPVSGSFLRPCRPEAIAFIRETVLRRLGIVPESRGRKIFVSRKGINRRKMINQDAVEAFFVNKGFISVQPENMRFAEQVRLFSEASHIVVDGSAILNSLFSPAKAKVLLLTNKLEGPQGLNGQIADLVGLDMVIFECDNITDTHVSKEQEDYVVNMDKLAFAVA